VVVSFNIDNPTDDSRVRIPFGTKIKLARLYARAV
jgi:hypothetical protein